MAEIAVPTFESLDKFIRWWQTPAIRSFIESDPQVLSELGGHPNIAPWVQRFMAQLHELHPSLSATPEAALRILTACTPEDKAAAETILYSCRENPEISEPAYTAKLASTGTIEGHETKPALFATLEKEDSLFAGTYQGCT